MSELHLDSLEIKNFRCFEHLTIEKLGRVNLIVGKNSVGKTCLLEAIRLYAALGNPKAIYEALVDREEVGTLNAAVLNGSRPILTLNQISDLVYKFAPDKIVNTLMTIGGRCGSNYQISIGFALYQVQDTGDQSQDTLLKVKTISAEDAEKQLNVQIGYSVQVDKDTPKLYSIPITIPLHSADEAITRHQSSKKLIFVSSGGINKGSLPVLWDKVVFEGLVEKVLQVLQVIEKGIIRVDMVANPQMPEYRYAVAKIQGYTKPIQLSNLGDGVARILGLATATVLSRDGYLLIDEFENGLHYSLQTEVWRFIFQIAQEFNIQVFVTTHSWDCVEAFHEAAAENDDDDAMLIRLQRKRDGSGIVAATYDNKSMDIVTRQGIEVR